ncbi:unnamed protein product [Blepharisma stoltei]|uniref:Peptidase C1A papain C-terminal domain-containing protein n=1 Tax=Blepharisma stoltei TaxID=1481888 RepID=A0AAU9J3P8_9CILI|nr:unnamed protein product [Blepharisma stoltei]
MSRFLLQHLLIVLFISSASGCFIKNNDIVPPHSAPETLVEPSSLPSYLFWGNYSGINYLTVSRNQHIPQYCGGCWSFASTSALADRFKILRNATWPDYNIAPQVPISCDYLSFGCNGGDPMTVYKYIYDRGITDETCATYQAKDRDNGLECTRLSRCKTCYSNGKCDIPDTHLVYNVTTYGSAIGETQMLNALQNGPIACAMDATNEFENYTGGIFIPTDHEVVTNHVVELVGYGVENNTKYWIGRNSWGTYWGEKGLFRIIRGKDALAIEEYCAWATPDPVVKQVNKTLVEEKTVAELKILEAFERPEKAGCRVEKSELKLQAEANGYVIEENAAPALPAAWDWRNMSGLNYMSWTRNMNNPQFCGACWAHAATSCIADRINILRNDTVAQISISPQVILNCNAGGNCTSGDPIGVYKFAQQYGLPDDTCQQYLAEPVENATCTARQVCETCIPPPPKEGQTSNCSAITNPPLWYVGSYGFLAGVTKMKQEIYTNGPISCGIYYSKSFENYKGGIFSELTMTTKVNYEVALVGWGVNKAGTEYWIGRNSQGTMWGESGFFRIQMYRDNLGIETDCSWAIPNITRTN